MLKNTRPPRVLSLFERPDARPTGQCVGVRDESGGMEGAHISLQSIGHCFLGGPHVRTPGRNQKSHQGLERDDKRFSEKDALALMLSDRLLGQGPRLKGPQMHQPRSRPQGIDMNQGPKACRRLLNMPTPLTCLAHVLAEGKPFQPVPRRFKRSLPSRFLPGFKALRYSRVVPPLELCERLTPRPSPPPSPLQL